MGIDLNEWVGEMSVKVMTLEFSLIILYLVVGVLAYNVYKRKKIKRTKKNVIKYQLCTHINIGLIPTLTGNSLQK